MGQLVDGEWVTEGQVNKSDGRFPDGRNDISLGVDRLFRVYLLVCLLTWRSKLGCLGGTGAGNGYTSLQVPLGDTTTSIGLDLFGQWFVTDVSATGGFAATPGAKWKIF